MSTPQLVAVVPSEDFLQSLSMADRRITLHRVFYDLFAQSFPAYAPRIPVTLIFCGGTGEYHGQVQLTDPGEYLVARAEFTFKASTLFVQHVVLAGELRVSGIYHLGVWLEGRLAMAVPVTVATLQPASRPTQRTTGGQWQNAGTVDEGR
jgi:hypothetical protein